MRNKFIIVAILMLLATTTIVYATAIGIKPPLGYINNLRTCTKSSLTVKQDGSVFEYIIKGKLPNGRCEVKLTSQVVDLTNKKAYEDYQLYMKDEADYGYSSDATKNLKDNYLKKLNQVCRYSQADREAIYKGYQKYTGKNVVDLQGLFFHSDGPCIFYRGDVPPVTKPVYVCEYADMSCSYTILNQGSSMICSSRVSGLDTSAKVKKLVEAGQCQQVF